MLTLVLNQAMALGNGDRKRGAVLATINGVTSSELLAEAFELVGSDLEQLPGTITPADGVAPCEILTALRNPRLCEFADVSEQVDEARPTEPKPPRGKRK